ncbi:uncharacterized protein LOC144868018 [Branchiostoma floridae x Branchiostoma japonicum]
MVTLRVNNCCECFGLRSGSLYIAVLYMVIGIFNIVMTIIGLASAGGEVARYGRITTDGTLVLLCILLLIGVLKSEYSLCIMWVVGAVVWSVLTIVLVKWPLFMLERRRTYTLLQLWVELLWQPLLVSCGSSWHWKSFC